MASQNTNTPEGDYPQATYSKENDMLPIISTDEICAQNCERLKSEDIIPIYAFMSDHMRQTACARLETELLNNQISPEQVMPMYPHFSQLGKEFVSTYFSKKLKKGLKEVIQKHDSSIKGEGLDALVRSFMAVGNSASYFVGLLTGHEKDDTKLSMHYGAKAIKGKEAGLYHDVGQYFLDNKKILGFVYKY